MTITIDIEYKNNNGIPERKTVAVSDIQITEGMLILFYEQPEDKEVFSLQKVIAMHTM